MSYYLPEGNASVVEALFQRCFLTNTSLRFTAISLVQNASPAGSGLAIKKVEILLPDKRFRLIDRIRITCRSIIADSYRRGSLHLHSTLRRAELPRSELLA
jgi:hypothetical protein